MPTTYQQLYQTDCGNLIYEQDSGYPSCVVLTTKTFARIGYVDTTGQDVLFEQDERGWCTLASEEADRLMAAGVWWAIN